jgi:hypothetical protein
VASFNDGRFIGGFSLALPALCLGGRQRALAGFGGLAEALADSGMLWRGLARALADHGGHRHIPLDSRGLWQTSAESWQTLAGFGGLLRPLAVIRVNRCGF